MPPLGGAPRRIAFQEEGQAVAPDQQDNWSAEWYPIGLDYFRTLRIPLLAGREFRPEDNETGAPVAMIGAAMARQFWPNENAIGKRIRLNVLYDQPRQIVGVVGDVRQDRYQLEPQAQLYVPRRQLPQKMDLAMAQAVMLVNTFIVRAKGNPAELSTALRPQPGCHQRSDGGRIRRWATGGPPGIHATSDHFRWDFRSARRHRTVRHDGECGQPAHQ
jgi:hypothetical protein